MLPSEGKKKTQGRKPEVQRKSSGRNEMEAPFPRFCSECGAANTWQATTCFACHEPLAQSASQPAAQPPIASLPVPIVPAPLVHLDPGSLLHERYKLLREIGQGGFGVVYLAEDSKRNQQRVAVKQINIGKLNTRETIDATASYNREVTLLSELKHRRIPRIYDYFTDPEHWYLVTDYIEGQTLEEHLRGAPGKALPLQKVIDIGIQLSEVLNYLHTQNPPIIFRDVKPANIMQTPRGQIYLIDFGIARRFALGRSRDTGPLGSPGYAPPEQYGKSQTTAHTDIYALGATLQTLVTGKDPLELQAGEASLSSGTRLHQKFSFLLGQMLEKESSKRPQSIREVRARLESLQRKKGKFVHPSLLGLLLGIAPYALFAGLTSFPFSSPIVLAYPLVWVLYCSWPFLFAGQLITATLMLFQSRKRFVGLGLLVGLALLVLALFLRLGAFSYLLSWPLFGGD
jgi:tRNA A-37 threonylcarbamoyl transferase component Bud32